MTWRQTELVCERVLALTREWLLARGATQGRYGGAAAYADLEADCYVGLVNVFFRAPEHNDEQRGRVEWRLDAAFEPLGEPTFSEGAAG